MIGGIVVKIVVGQRQDGGVRRVAVLHEQLVVPCPEGLRDHLPLKGRARQNSADIVWGRIVRRER